MELGNMMFGNSRGSFPIERGEGWEQEICRLVEAYTPLSEDDRDPPEFENHVFSVFPYYWGECDCGFDEQDEKWSAEHRHAASCYQSRVYFAVKAYDKQIGYRESASLMDMFFTDSEPVMINGQAVGEAITMSPIPDEKGLYKAHQKFEDNVRQKLCAELGLSYPTGCAVHCTCSHDSDYDAWRQINNHASTCLLIKPNFLYKPTGFEIQWYKYPLRDSYKNMNVGLADFKSMVDVCIQSLKAAQVTACA